MRALSLFSGIGGLDLAAEYAQIDIVGQVELDPYCLQVLARHWPHVLRIANVFDVTGSEFGPLDIIFGGIPCQPFSTAGKRRGRDDSRYLWPEMRRVLRAAQPRWVVIENVANIVNVGLDDIWTELETDGYTVGAYILPAHAVGTPHRRERLFIVAYAQRGGRRWWTHAPSRNDRDRAASQWDESAHGVAGAGEVLSDKLCVFQHIRERAITLEFESRLGRIINGLPAWMDQSRWPSAPTNTQRPWEPRRAGTDILTDDLWKKRVRALGNAVVPQQAYPLFAAIAAADTMLFEPCD